MIGETTKYMFPWIQLPAPVLFPFFARLPAELQCKIWLAAIPSSRIVDIIYSQNEDRYVSKCPPPSILSVCRASREVAIPYYQKLKLGDNSTPMLFNFTTDKLYFSVPMPAQSEPCIGFVETLSTCPSRHLLRSVLVDTFAFDVLAHAGLLIILAEMDELEEIGLVTNYKDAYKHGLLWKDFSHAKHKLIPISDRYRFGRTEAMRRQRLRRQEMERSGEKEDDRRIRVRSLFLMRHGKLL
jgi:hypothetical protein